LYAVCIRLEVQARNTLLVRGRQSEMSDSLSHHDVSLASLCLKADISEFNVHLEPAYTHFIYSHIEQQWQRTISSHLIHPRQRGRSRSQERNVSSKLQSLLSALWTRANEQYDGLCLVFTLQRYYHRHHYPFLIHRSRPTWLHCHR